MGEERIRDGFPGERMHVLPRPLVSTALTTQPTSQMLVTDAGFFPQAAHHWRSRPAAKELIVIHCASGQGRCRVGERNLTVAAGQVLLIPPGVAHRYAADADSPWTIWWAHIAGTAVPFLLDAIGGRKDSPVFDVAEPARISSLLDTILRRMEADESQGSLIAAGGAAWHLLAVIAADRRTNRRGMGDPIAAVQNHLRENLAQRITVAELAAMTGFSVSHFSALFRKATGLTAPDYQTRLRMSLARKLLDTTERTVSSIGRQVGYEDPMYFSRQFRRIHHMSPTQFRERGFGPAGDGGMPSRSTPGPDVLRGDEPGPSSRM